MKKVLVRVIALIGIASCYVEFSYGMLVTATRQGTRRARTVSPTAAARAVGARQGLEGGVQRPTFPDIQTRGYRASEAPRGTEGGAGSGENWWSRLWHSFSGATQVEKSKEQPREEQQQEQKEKKNYSNRSASYTPLGLELVKMFHRDHYARQSLGWVERSTRQLIESGMVLNHNDKQLLLNYVRAYIKDKLAYSIVMTTAGIQERVLNFQDISIRELIEFADKLLFIIKLGADLSSEIDVSNLEKFKTLSSGIDEYSYIFLSGMVLSKRHTGDRVKDSRIGESTTISGMHRVVQLNSIPFLDEDIGKIMGYLSDKSLSTMEWPIREGEVFHLVKFAENGLLDMDKVEEAARRGVLRVSLLQVFGLLPSWQSRNKKSIEYKMGSDDLKDKIYELLQQSNKVEKERILKLYSQLCNIPSFMKNIPTGFSKQSGARDREGAGKTGSGYTGGAAKVEIELFTLLRKYVPLSDNPTSAEVTKARRATLRKIHPDFASDPAEEARRTKETQELNNLYEEYMASGPQQSARQSARE